MNNTTHKTLKTPTPNDDPRNPSRPEINPPQRPDIDIPQPTPPQEPSPEQPVPVEA